MTVECTKCYRQYPGAVSGCDCCSDLAGFIEDLESVQARAETLVSSLRGILEWQHDGDAMNVSTAADLYDAIRHELERAQLDDPEGAAA